MPSYAESDYAYYESGGLAALLYRHRVLKGDIFAEKPSQLLCQAATTKLFVLSYSIPPPFVWNSSPWISL